MATSELQTKPQLNNIVSKSKKVFFYFMEHIFSNHANPQFRWIPEDLENSKLILFDKDGYDPTEITEKPKIIIMRNGFQQTEHTVGNRLDNNPWGLKTLGDPTKLDECEDHFLTLIGGSVTMLCTSRVALEAEDIAFEVFSGLSSYRSIFMKCGFHKLDPPQIGATQKINYQSEVPATFGVSVTQSFTITYPYLINKTIEDDIFEYINLQVTADYDI